MASANFTTTENPLSSPWATVTGGGALRATGGECGNAGGSDADSGMRYGSSSANESIFEYRSGTFDGGPAFFDSSGNGYVSTCYSGTTVEMYRMDGGFPGYNRMGSDAAVTFAAGDVAKLAIVGNDIVFYKNNTEIFRQTDTTYRTGLSPAIFAYAGNLRVDNWTDGASGNAYTLAIGQGSYSLSGQATALRAARRITVAQGSYSLTGQAVVLKFGHKISVAQGGYTLNGQAVTLDGPDASFSLSVESGLYSLVGSDAVADFAITISAGSYALAGQSVGLKYGHKTAIAQGSYALTGRAVALRATRYLGIGQGSYSINGQAITLTYRDPTPVLTVQAGGYSLSGSQVGLLSSQNSGEIYRTIPLNWWTKGL